MQNIAYVDDFCDNSIIAAVEEEWPDRNWPYWYRYDNGKLATHDEIRIPPAAKYLLQQMIVFGIPKEFNDGCQYFADWTFYGAGLHCMPSESRLGTHLDSELHPNNKWFRSFSMVLSINSVWHPKWGGEFYFQDNKLESEATNRIELPVTHNRLTVFKCTDTSFHGVKKITCPEGFSRKTLAVFFWRRINHGAPINGLRTRANFYD